LSQALAQIPPVPLLAQAPQPDGARALVSRLAARGVGGRKARVTGDTTAPERDGGGGPGGFEELFRAHRPDVARLCRRLLPSEAAAEDAVQDIYLRGRRGFDGYDSKRPFRHWILGIASNHCVDQLRRHGRERRLFDPGDVDADALAAPGSSPLRHALDTEQSAQLLGAIDALPPRYRLPLVLRYYEELDYDGIAEILGVTRNQVATLLFRAKGRLRDALPGGRER
jgi:RNA polymerase sigma factor (sigma-70 family)